MPRRADIGDIPQGTGLAAKAGRWLLLAQLAVLAATALLTIAAYTMVAPGMAIDAGSTARVDASVRQRMHALRIALLATQVADSPPGGGGRETRLRELREATSTLEAEHRVLLAGSPAPGLPGRDSPALSERGLGSELPLAAELRQYLDSARAFLDDPPAAQSRSNPHLAELQRAVGGPLLLTLDLATREYQAEGERGIARLAQRRRLLLLLTLLLLAGGGGLLLALARRVTVAERAVALAEARLRGAISHSPLAIVTFGSDGGVQDLNTAAARMLQREAPEVLGGPIGTLIATDPQSRNGGESVEAFLASGQARRVTEPHLIRADGSTFPAELTLVAHGGPAAPLFSAYVRDLSLRRAAERERRLATKVLASVGDAMMIADANNQIVEVNPAFTAITGYSREEVLGRNPSLLKSGRQNAAFYRELWTRLVATGSWEGIIWNRRKSGDVYPEWLRISTIRDEQGEIEGRIAVFSDATERLHHEDVLLRQAQTDEVTRLPNRHQFLQRLGAALAAAKTDGTMVALFFLDLDSFKGINDTLGHAAGDALLRLVADRLRTTLPPSDFVARLGGDEFTVIQCLATLETTEETALRLGKELSGSVAIGEREVELSSSIGIALFPTDGGDVPSLLRAADVAMLSAKRAGGHTHRFGEDSGARRIQRGDQLKVDFPSALRTGQLHLLFQPIVELAQGITVGREALARWHHPALGVLAPPEFLAAIEESGHVLEFGDWVLDSACRAAARWGAGEGGAQSFSVNVSSRHFIGTHLVKSVERALATSGLAPEALELEFREDLLFARGTDGRAVLRALRALRVGLVIDAFGTGHSSIEELCDLPITGLKLAPGLVQGVGTEARADALVAAVVALARSLALKLIAMGVETPTQADALRRLGCKYGQGFHLGAPVAAGDLRHSTDLPSS